MKKILIIVILLFLGTVGVAQTTVTTIDTKACYWNKEVKKFTDSCKYIKDNPSRFSFNYEETMLVHTTSEGTSTYYVDKTAHQEEDDRYLYVYFITSDLGDKYIIFIDFKYNEIRFMPEHGEYTVSTTIKSVFKEEKSKY